MALTSKDLLYLEKWGLCEDATEWPKSWLKVLMKFLFACSVCAGSGFWFFSLVLMTHDMRLIIAGGFGILVVTILVMGLIKTMNDFRALILFAQAGKSVNRQPKKVDSL